MTLRPALEETLLHQLVPKRSQMSWRAVGSPQEAKPLANSEKSIPARAAWRLAHSCPLQPDLGRVGEIRTDLDEARPELGVENIEVVHPDPALLLDEFEYHRLPGLSRPFLGAKDPLELLGRRRWPPPRSDRHVRLVRDRGRTWSSLRSSHRVRSGFFSCRMGMSFLSGEGLDLPTETVADLFE